VNPLCLDLVILPGVEGVVEVGGLAEHPVNGSTGCRAGGP
jgi:hypothetical protein